MGKRMWATYKQSSRGFRGYPVATVALYGPSGDLATKIAVAIIASEDEDEDAMILRRWWSQGGDVRDDRALEGEMLDFIQEHGVRTVVLTDRIIGCPHEEGKDYPEGEVCPECPYWAHRDRWSGEMIQ